MSFDINEFLDMFFEEVEEHVSTLEHIFLEMNASGTASSDDINEAFRAAHSIKGGAGTFGFTEVQTVAHALESALDTVRKGDLEISDDVVTLFLEALDALRAGIDARRNGQSIDEKDNAPLVDSLYALAKKMQKQQDRPESPKAKTDKKPKPQEPEKAKTEPGAGDQSKKLYRATLTYPDEVIPPLLQALGEVGEIVAQEQKENALEIRIKAAAPPGMLKEVIAFYGDPNAAVIEEISESESAQDVQVASEKSQQSQEKAKTDAIEGEDFGLFDNASATAEASAKPELQKSQITPTKAKDQIEKEGEKQSAALTKKDAPPRQQRAEISSIRVNVQRIDQLVNLVGEFVIAQAMLMDALKTVDRSVMERLSDVLDILQQRSSELQEAVLSIRMLPIGTIFSRLPRVVHDLCRKLGKEADLELVGEETELDKNMIEALTDPLIHLVRNCIDHGIEMPEERLKAGKPGRGAITIRAAHEGGGIVIEIKDDGKGLDRQKLLAKAREKGLLPSEKADEELSDEQVYGLIMLPGFSTAGAVTEISGRGVGMDVVKRNVEQLGGRIQIQSTPGQGTIFTLRLPLTLAIIDGMLISVGEEVYVVPLTTILESRKPNPSDLKTVASRGRMLKVREEYLPVIDLAELFNIEAKTKDESESIVVIVDAQGQKAALIVDDLLGQTQVVVKSLSQNFKKIAGFAGATILGNGKVTLILDCAGLLNMQQHITEV